MPQRTIAFGIMAAALKGASQFAPGAVLPPEPRLSRNLSAAAASLGIDVYVFSPDGFDPDTGKLAGCKFEQGGWKLALVPLPDVVYDRSFPKSADSQRRCAAALSGMSEWKHHERINGRLPSKLQVYDCLRGRSAIAPYLPQTAHYRTVAQLEEILPELPQGAVLKPAAGMQGRGFLHIEASPWTPGELTVFGRTRNNVPFKETFRSFAALGAWLQSFMGSSPFLVQPYLPLRSADDRPYDIRVLLQKDERGTWQVSGSAARLGSPDSLTSNLHGGGVAEPAADTLAANFMPTKAEHLLKKIHAISGQTALLLEESFGRFGELAFDFGLEPSGKLWLLEVNAKPGRESFHLTGDQKAAKLSIIRLLQYARYLTNRNAPTFPKAGESASDRLSRPESKHRP
ncbi:YheC/YheD family protein [Paenibacillus sp. LHD-117]|uniref:YheC/YheD family endospore coat-associated protein n=1 Tax=Paenibacillus sp. LHD-117 TaxID=3071412 RepID=UPI0027DEE10A|nr:YheC/YheD family protein [Paenibacillus sp. LHD-117]MDQ6422348.1 YheC/YheD family protein [Paenibacillus sp. LHD-117]